MKVQVLLLSICTLVLPFRVEAGGGNAFCEEPNIMILLDYSGSMRDNGKWTTAVSAVNQLTNVFGNSTRIGLTLFPFGGDCSVNSSNTVFPCQINSAVAISSILSTLYPDGGTPMGPGLRQVEQYYNDLNDPDRRSFVVLVTDGEPTCRTNCGDARNAAQALFDNEIQVFVIGFGTGTDTQCNNSIAAAGGTQMSLSATAGPELYEQLEAVFNRARDEVCDGLDNDCDGVVDEGIAERPCETTCGAGVQRCTNGDYGACSAGIASTDVCDGTDNDCDGVVDEASQCDVGELCLTGECLIPCPTGVCPPGSICEDGGCYPTGCGVTCENNEICIDGECALTCESDSDCPMELRCVDEVCAPRVCQAPIMSPEPEMCDGYDNDCDGQTDEGVRNACGACGLAPPELCDQVDNDCDGRVDEAFPEEQMGCSTQSDGLCQLGILECFDGTIFCRQVLEPEAEVCNELDDDCDGTVDEDASLECMTQDGSVGRQVCMDGQLLPVCVTSGGASEEIVQDCRTDDNACRYPLRCLPTDEGRYECREVETENDGTNDQTAGDARNEATGDGDEVTRDCRNDGLGCNEPFECKRNSRGRYECLQADMETVDGGTTSADSDASEDGPEVADERSALGCSSEQKNHGGGIGLLMLLMFGRHLNGRRARRRNEAD